MQNNHNNINKETYLVWLVVENDQVPITYVEPRQMITRVLRIKYIFIDDKRRATRLWGVATINSTLQPINNCMPSHVVLLI